MAAMEEAGTRAKAVWVSGFVGERMMVLSLESWKMQCQPTAFRHTTSLSCSLPLAVSWNAVSAT
jgi:hypothetical protein